LRAKKEQFGAPGHPVALAIDGAAAHLKGRGNQNPKYIVFISDGGSPGAPCDDTTNSKDLAAVTNAKAAGISTFVLGIDVKDELKALLNKLATAGGEPAKGAPNAYYDGASKADFVKLLTSVAERMACQSP
jgi:hypothetical protein